MNFSARLTCPLGDPEKNKKANFRVDNGALGATGLTLSLAQNVCTWEGFQINGVDVTESLMTGSGPFYPDGTWSAEGYDFGRLSNGDNYLAQWSEKSARCGVPTFFEGKPPPRALVAAPLMARTYQNSALVRFESAKRPRDCIRTAHAAPHLVPAVAAYR